MTREFVYTEPFRKSWAAMGLTDSDSKELEDVLLENPHTGAVIQGTGGARKMRITLYGHGKSGGARVIYLDILEKERLYFLLSYPKNVQADLTNEQKKAIKSLIDQIKKE